MIKIACTKYVNESRIRTIRLPNGRYEYNNEDVYRIFNKVEVGALAKYVEKKEYIEYSPTRSGGF